MLKLLTAAFALALCAASAHAEPDGPAPVEDHFWISKNKGYLREDGETHCCGRAHCGVIPQDAIEAIPDEDGLIVAWRVRDGSGQIFKVGQPYALYDSIDTQHWGCKAEVGYHCIFPRLVGG
jgi:hypothetical protein